ncbi:MAG: HEAT repeat domain-containing protein [Sandaracinus sp.]
MAAIDVRDLERRAQRAVQARRYDEALPLLWMLVDRPQLESESFRAHLRLLASCFAGLGKTRALVAAHLFLGNLGDAERAATLPLDRARIAQARKDHASAARAFEEAGWLGHAAIALEEAKNDTGARILWERLGADPRLTNDLYTRGLVRFDHGRACLRLGDRVAGRKSVVEAMHLLTAAADGFEARGLRERAFDCYGVLLTIGREGSFENLAEGYLNCIRILREDGLKNYVVQYYDDFGELALQRKELHAAATLFREVADYARRQSLPYVRHYRKRSAEAHLAAANEGLAAGTPAEMAENAYAAAIDAYNELGLYSKVQATYTRMATLDLGDKRRERYTRLATRLSGLKDDDASAPAFPDYLRAEVPYPEIWRLDVVEWEQQGDPAETMADILLDPRQSDSVRRRALVVRMFQHAADELVPATLVTLAGQLTRVESYAVLSPLEKMLEHEQPGVRAAVLGAVKTLYFKRSYVAIRRGLADPAPEVRAAAIAAMQQLHFGHVFDPLQRIYRESEDADVRRTALHSLGQISSVEAVEVLIDVLRSGVPAERAIARECLVRAEHAEASGILRRAAADETGQAREELERIVRARGG